MQASAFTKYMGNLTVYFDYLGRYVKWEGGPIFLDRSIPEGINFLLIFSTGINITNALGEDALF